MSYCTLAEARAEGATGTDEQVQAAIDGAQERIDAFTGDVFEPTTTTVVAYASSGLALLPRRLQAVTAVVYDKTSLAADVSAWRVRTSETPGDIDAIELATHGGDYLIVGAEPYNGGWARLHEGEVRLRVTGTFGWDEPPQAVRRAAALLAAALAPGQGSTDAEGNAVGTDASLADQAGLSRTTTGLPEADALLTGAGLRRGAVRIS